MTSLSIVVPVYNVDAYLAECLDSLLHQNIDDLEVILVNDGSTDHSQEIIDRYVELYPKIFCSVTQQNLGQSAARNRGLEYCTKEYLAFVDSDDYLVEGAYQKILLSMQKDKMDIGVFEEVWVYPDGRKEYRPSLPSFLHEYNVKTAILSHCTPCGRIFKTKLWKDSGLRFPVGIWYEDLAVIPAFSMLTDKIKLYPIEAYCYRQHKNSITSSFRYSERFLQIIPACQNIYALLHNKGFEEELEYLMLFQLCYYASFRFLLFDKFDEIHSCIRALEVLYPNWQNNSYYRMRPFLFRFYCRLLKNGHFRLAKFLAKCKGSH